MIYHFNQLTVKNYVSDIVDVALASGAAARAFQNQEAGCRVLIYIKIRL